MISISEAARQAIAEFFTAEPGTPRVIRIFISPGNCTGPGLNMALDDVDPDDVRAEFDGVTYCVARGLSDRIGRISVDMKGENFSITAERPMIDPTVFAGGCSCGCSCPTAGDENACGSGGCSCGCC